MIENDPRIDPRELRHVRFPGSSRRYDVKAVDQFVAVLVERVEATNALVDDLLGQLEIARSAPAPAPTPEPMPLAELTEDELVRLVGEETTTVLSTARRAAEDIRAKAEENAERVIREATAEARRLVEAAGDRVVELTAEAQDAHAVATAAARSDAERIRQEAERDAHRVLAEAKEQARDQLASVEARRVEVQDEAAQVLVAARDEGRGMVAEAREVRGRILDDLQRRRDAARLQIDELVTGRDRLLAAYGNVRADLDDITARLEALAPTPADEDADAPGALDEEEPEPAAWTGWAASPDAPAADDTGLDDTGLDDTGGSDDTVPADDASPVEGDDTVVPDDTVAPAEDLADDPVDEGPVDEGPVEEGPVDDVVGGDDTSDGTSDGDGPVHPVDDAGGSAGDPSEPDDPASAPNVDPPVDDTASPVDEPAPPADDAVPPADDTLATDEAEDAGADEVIPVADGPVADAPVADAPAAATPVAESLPTDVPVADVPAADVPAADVPVADVPVADVPVADVPVADVPVDVVPVVVETVVVETVDVVPGAIAAVEADDTLDARAADDDVAAPSGDVDALFARLRSEREASVAQAHRVLDGDAAPTTDDAPAATEAEEPGVGEVDAVDDDVVHVPSALAAPADLLELRANAVSAEREVLGRALKRCLADEQNEVLDRLRRNGVASVDELFGSAADHALAYRDAALFPMAAVLRAGGALVGGGSDPSPDDDAVQALADELATGLVEPLRRRAERAIESVDGDVDGLDERLRALYREWKAQHLPAALDDALLSGFARGTLAGADPAETLRWTIDPDQGPCPDAEDNALAGEVVAGEPFPTGDPCPQAHPGCRCLLVPTSF